LTNNALLALQAGRALSCFVGLAALVTLSGCVGSSTSSPGGSSGPAHNYVCDSGTFGGSASVSQLNPFFGMHVHSLEPSTSGGNGTPWPSTIPLSDPSDTVQFARLRLWDSGTGWAEINTASGTCDFSHMDSWLTEAEANNTEVLYDLGRTPTWASSNPNDTTCSYADSNDSGPGQCDPPTDLNSDGTGADAIWIGWVTSVANRYKGQIKYYEIWNEWNISLFWTGTPQQMVRMTQDARCVIEGPPAGSSCNSESTFPEGTGIDTDARVITPAPVGSAAHLDGASKQMTAFLSSQAGGNGPGDFFDVVGFHCYVSQPQPGMGFPIPENVLTVNGDLNSTLQSFSSIVQGKPVFCTEGGFGNVVPEDFTDPSLQAAFLARFYLLQNVSIVSRVYWYAWDDTSTNPGGLWDPSTGPKPAATAYAEVYNWITGATASGPCSEILNTTIYTCGFTRANGYQALAVWDSNPAASCYKAGVPSTCSSFTIPAPFTLSRNLSGSETGVTPGSAIQLSAAPILLETGPLP
jgi:hypothetical protein